MSSVTASIPRCYGQRATAYRHDGAIWKGERKKLGAIRSVVVEAMVRSAHPH